MSNDPTTKTALDLVTGALRKIGQYAPGEALDANDAQDALDTLNDMLDMWSIQRLSVYGQIETVKALTSGQATYTVGVGGDFNMVRPVALSNVYSRLNTSGNTVDFPCRVVDLDNYATIGLKNQPGPWPKVLFYNTDVPLGTFTFWPVPTSAVEVHIWSDQVLTSLALSDVVNLPKGYFFGLQMNLCELLCMEYGQAATEDIKRFAKTFRDLIKAMNATPQAEVRLDAAIATSNGNDAGWYLSGGFQ